MKLIFCDIDGTILDGARNMPEVSAKTRYAFKALQEGGNCVFLSSGRCKGLLKKSVLELEPDGLVLCNGAYSEYHQQMISAVNFTPEAVEKIAKAVIGNDGFYIFETLDDMYVDSYESEPFRMFGNGWGIDLKKFSERNADEVFYIAMAGFLSEEKCHSFENDISGIAEAVRHNFSRSYDINVAGIDKGYGVKKVIEYLNVGLEDTYCFGDGLNDLQMLEAVGNPVIMANSNPFLKTRGFDQTDDVLDEGFYNYLVRRKLIKAL